MTPKLSWAEKLKRWQKGKDEALAKAMMSPPEATTLLRAVPFPGVIIIMGARGKGKSGRASQVDYTGLSGCIVSLVRAGAQTRDRCHVDNAPATLSRHDPSCCLKTEESGPKVKVQHATPFRLSYLQQGCNGHVAGIVDQHIQMTPFLDNLLCGRCDG